MKQYILPLFIAIIMAAVFVEYDKAITKENKYAHLGGDFTLQSTNGPRSLKEFRGKAVVLYFGFTSCPDVCPTALSYLTSMLDKLTLEERKKLQTIFISVDHKQDSPKTVQEYADFFGNDIIGLTGDAANINMTTKQYGAYYSFAPIKNSKLKYTVNHSSRFYLIDKQGALQEAFIDRVGHEKFLKRLRQLL